MKIFWTHYRKCKENSIINSYLSELEYDSNLFPDNYTNLNVKFNNFVYSYLHFIKALIINKKRIHIISHPIFLAPTVLLKKLSGTKVVYYPFEIFGHQSVNSSFIGKILAFIWVYLEAKTISHCNLLITQNKLRSDYYISRFSFSGKVLELPNIKKNASLKIVKTNSDSVSIIYAGLITQSRFLTEFIQSLKYLPRQYSLILCGKSELEDSYLSQKLSEFSGRLIHYGEFGVDEVVTINKQIRIGFLAYENSTLNNSYAAPSKIFDYVQNHLIVCSNMNLGIEQLVPSELLEVFDEKSQEVSQSIALSIIRANQKYLTINDNVFDDFLEKFSFRKNLIKLKNELSSLNF